jgi:arginase
MKTGSSVRLIVVPYDSGRRGARMGAGPGALAPLLDRRLTADGHAVQRVTIDPPSESWRAEIATAFELARAVADAVRAARRAGAFPLVLSGNCGPAAIGCVAAEPAPAVFWFDAHGDFNTPETTSSGFLDGMQLATLTGRCWRQLARRVDGFRALDETSVALVGARDLDPPERQQLDASRIRQVPPGDYGAELTAAVGLIAEQCVAAYVHLDLDVLDPSEGRANVYAAPGGLSRQDVEWGIEQIRANFFLYAASLTSFDPEADVDGRARDAAVRLGVALVEASPDPGVSADGVRPARR